MHIDMSQTGDSILFTIHGEINEQGAETIKKRVRDATKSKKCAELIFDMKDVTHIGSAGIGKFLLFYKDIALENGQIKLINSPSHILHLLKSMKLDSLFTIS